MRKYAKLEHSYIDAAKIPNLDREWLSPVQISAIGNLAGRAFAHRWQLAGALAAQSPQWSRKDDTTVNKLYNQELDWKLDYVQRIFSGFPARR